MGPRGEKGGTQEKKAMREEDRSGEKQVGSCRTKRQVPGEKRLGSCRGETGWGP